MKCANCGFELKRDAKFCGKCGEKKDTELSQEQSATLGENDNNQVNNLHKHWYYRLLKVFFVILYVSAIVFALNHIVKKYYPVTTFNQESSKISCIGGNAKTFRYQELVSEGGTLYSAYDLIDKCELRQGHYCEANPKFNPNTTGTHLSYFDQLNSEPKEICSFKVNYDQIISSGIEKYYKIDKVYDHKGGWGLIIVFSALSILAISACFEIIRRMFYYVTLGSFKII